MHVLTCLGARIKIFVQVMYLSVLCACALVCLCVQVFDTDDDTVRQQWRKASTQEVSLTLQKLMVYAWISLPLILFPIETRIEACLHW